MASRAWKGLNTEDPLMSGAPLLVDGPRIQCGCSGKIKNPLRLSRIEPKILCRWVCNLFNSLPELPGNNLVIIQQGFKDLSFINQIKATVSIMPFPCHWFEGTTSVIVVSRAHTSASWNIPSPPTDNRKAPADSWDKEVRYLKILPTANVYGVVIQ